MGFLTTTEAARVLNVCEATVRNLDKRGELLGYRDHLGRRRFRTSDVEKLKEARLKITVSRVRGDQ
jgi:excisionase family DNA binding protein